MTLKPRLSFNPRVPDPERNSFHSECFACGSRSERGLHLHFEQQGDRISGSITIGTDFQSYEGITHGGIITTLLDAAMVRCLYNVFHQQPFTCRLDVRFRHSVPTNVPVVIKAHIVSKRTNRCAVEAEVRRENQLCVRGQGVFMLR